MTTHDLINNKKEPFPGRNETLSCFSYQVSATGRLLS